MIVRAMEDMYVKQRGCVGEECGWGVKWKLNGKY